MHRSKQRALFDHLVGASEQRRWHGEAERPRGLEIDRQLELGRLLDRQFALLEADRQLADNQAELAKMWAELGKQSLVAS